MRAEAACRREDKGFTSAFRANGWETKERIQGADSNLPQKGPQEAGPDANRAESERTEAAIPEDPPG